MNINKQITTSYKYNWENISTATPLQGQQNDRSLDFGNPYMDIEADQKVKLKLESISDFDLDHQQTVSN